MNSDYLDLEMHIALEQELSGRELSLYTMLKGGMILEEAAERLGVSLRTCYRDREKIIDTVFELASERVFPY